MKYVTLLLLTLAACSTKKSDMNYPSDTPAVMAIGMEYNFRWINEDGKPSTDLEADIKKFLAKTSALKKVEVEVVVDGETYDMTYAEWKERMTMRLDTPNVP